MSSINISDLLPNFWNVIKRSDVTNTPQDSDLLAPISSNWAYYHLKEEHGKINDIGTPGEIGFGVGVCPGPVPNRYTVLHGTRNRFSDQYGNYVYQDGSVQVWIPKFYYRIGHPTALKFQQYGVHTIEIASAGTFFNTAEANAAGWALPRAFINNGFEHDGFMVDKYQCSNNSSVASSIKDQVPLTASSAQSGFSQVGADNSVKGAVAAAKTRGSLFHCMTRFEWFVLSILSMAHAQHVSNQQMAGWYDPLGVSNFPKGNNNNLTDVNDSDVTWDSAGYEFCGLTGSAGYGTEVFNSFTKSTHNGQMSGVADLNGNVREVNIGITRPGNTVNDNSIQNNASQFYVLKEDVDVNRLTNDWGNTNSVWGDQTHLEQLYTSVTLSQIASNPTTLRFGNFTNVNGAVFSPNVSGTGWRATNTGVYQLTGKSSTGLNLYGQDAFVEAHIANLTPLSGGSYTQSSDAGIWATSFNANNNTTGIDIGFRTASYTSRPFTLTFRTTEPNTTISLFAQNVGTYNALIHWGDTTEPEFVSDFSQTNISHVYTNPGDYEVSFYGEYPSILLSNSATANRLLLADYGEEHEFLSLINAFENAENLVSMSAILTENVQNYTNTWRNNRNLQIFKKINTSSGQLFVQTWENCEKIEQFPTLNMNSGLNFTRTWKNNFKLKNIPTTSFNLGEEFVETWENCIWLQEFPVITVPNGVNFTRTWKGNIRLTAFPVIMFDSGEIFEGTWQGCSGLDEFPSVNLLNGTTFKSAWRACSKIESFPSLDLRNSSTYQAAWADCISLEQFPAGLFDQWDVEPVPDCFKDTWLNCVKLSIMSVEHILTSILASNKNAPVSGNEITIDHDIFSGGITANTVAVIEELKLKGWKVVLNRVEQ